MNEQQQQNKLLIWNNDYHPAENVPIIKSIVEKELYLPNNFLFYFSFNNAYCIATRKCTWYSSLATLETELSLEFWAWQWYNANREVQFGEVPFYVLIWKGANVPTVGISYVKFGTRNLGINPSCWVHIEALFFSWTCNEHLLTKTEAFLRDQVC